MGIVLVREECRVRPKLGRVGERERNKEGERWRKKEAREGGILGGMWPASDHVCWLD